MKNAFLIIDSTANNVDLFYLTHFSAPDSYIYFSIDDKKHVVLSDLEYNKGKEYARVDYVLKLSDYTKSGAKGMVDIIDRIFKDKNITNITVQKSFSYALGQALKERGYTIEVYPHAILKEREIKRPEEIICLRDSLNAARDAIDFGIRIIRESKVRNKILYWKDEILTSETLRKELFNFLLERECISVNEEGIDIITSAGRYSAMPHHHGTGPIPVNEPVIFDVFPRSMKTGYFGDMTRTVVKGKAHPKLKKMYEAVMEGQEIAFERIKDGVNGQDIHQAICDLFVKKGLPNYEKNGEVFGFIHGTGHGLGLEIHEPPRISFVSTILKTGNVASVEPGLYYEDVGGVRIEDIILVQDNGCEILTKYPRELEVE